MKRFSLVVAAGLLGMVAAAADHQAPYSEHSEQLFAEVSEGKTPGHYYVHLIPHTHDDVGWLKTVDMLYTGSNNTYQPSEVELIIDNMVDELLKNSKRRFSYVEQKFFQMWYKRQTPSRQAQVKLLVANGQLELINGGWSMHDEACTHYDDMIENMRYGADFIEKEFGKKPRIGWQIDPFGHSNTNARLFAEYGFDAWFFARLDYQDRANRKKNKEMEFIWRPSFDLLGNSSQIFTHAFWDFYYSPSEFGWDDTM